MRVTSVHVPNPIKFTYVPNVCNHGGLVVEGQIHFEVMIEEYGIPPILEHHTCLVDLVG